MMVLVFLFLAVFPFKPCYGKTKVKKEKPKALPKLKEKVKKESLIEKLNHEESLFGELLVTNHQDLTKAKKNKKK